MYARILVPTDGSKLSDKAVQEAAQLARALGSVLLVLHVRSPMDIPHHAAGGALTDLGERKIMEEIEEEEKKLLEAAMEIAAAAGISAETAFVADLAPYEAIIRIARDEHCDLIVMASHGRRGVRGLLLGSEAQKVLTHTGTPVLIVR